MSGEERLLSTLQLVRNDCGEEATAYMLNQWDALTRFVQDGRLSPDNNLAEQKLCSIALGRKNYLFCGSHEAARRAAVLYSITRTWALHGVAPLAYLTDIPPGLRPTGPKAASTSCCG